jgi:endoglucanase
MTMQMLGGWLIRRVDQRWIIIGSKGPVRAVWHPRRPRHACRRADACLFARQPLLDMGAATEAEVTAMEPATPWYPTHRSL